MAIFNVKIEIDIGGKFEISSFNRNISVAQFVINQAVRVHHPPKKIRPLRAVHATDDALHGQTIGRPQIRQGLMELRMKQTTEGLRALQMCFIETRTFIFV